MHSTQPGLGALLQRRLCHALEASSSTLWTLPSLQTSDDDLRNHIHDNSLRALHAFFGSEIVISSIETAVDQTFSTYPTHVRIVIVSQVTSLPVLARIASRLPLYAHKASQVKSEHDIDGYKTQLLYAATYTISVDRGKPCVIDWLKLLVGNLVPIIMDAISDWDDLENEDDTVASTGLEDDGQTQPVSLLVNSEPDDAELAELLEKHLVELDSDNTTI